MKSSVKKSIVTRVRLAFLGVMLFSGAIAWKISRIQYQEGAKWRALEQERRISYQPVPATRGNIYSDNECNGDCGTVREGAVAYSKSRSDFVVRIRTS